MTVDIKRKPIVATMGVAMRDTPFIMAASPSRAGMRARSIQTMAAARPTRKTGKPSTNPTSRMIKGRNALPEVVAYVRLSI